MEIENHELKKFQDWQKLFNTAFDPLILLDLNGNVITLNEKTANILDKNVDELMSLNIYSFMAPNEVKLFKAQINNIARLGKPVRIEKEIFGAILDLSVNPIFDEQGKVEQIAFLSHDITERKKKEEELEKTYSKLNQIFNITIPLCVIDKKLNIIRINNTFSSIFNVKREEIIGRKCYDIIPGPLCNTPECIMRQILGGKDHWDYEKDFELVNGTKIVCNMRAVPYRGPDGEIIGIIKNFTDITARKKAENILRDSEEFLQNIFDGIQDGVSVLDKDLNIIRTNYWMEKKYNSDIPFIGKKCYVVYQKRTSPCPWCPSKLTLETGGSHSAIGPYPSIENPIKWLEIVTFPFKNSDGATVGIIEHIKDITAQKEAKEKLKVSETKLKILNKELEQKVEERTKELECLYNLSKIIEDKKITKENIMIRAVNLLPSTWQFPDITCARIQVDNKECETANFMKTKWNQSSEIFVNDKKVGFVEVSYLEEMPSFDTGPFLKEERVLIDEIAERLGRTFERLDAEQKLKESEEKHRYFFYNAQVGLFWSSIIDGKFLECNDTFAKLVGYNTREECLADYIAIEHYMNLKDRDEMLEKINMSGDIKNYEMQLSKRDGTPFWASISARINLIENRIEGAATDITERKIVEVKLKESEKRYRHLFETSPYAIVLTDRDGHLIDCNDAIKKYISMHSKLDVIGKSFKEIFSLNKKNKDLITLFEAYFDKILKGETKEPFEIQLYQSKDGFMWCHVQGSRVQIGNKELVQFIIQDITDKKKAEQKLKESEEISRNIINNISDVLMDGNIDGTITFISPQIYDIIGYHSKELIGIKFLDLIHPEEKKIYGKLINEPQKAGDKFSFELRALHKKGYYVPISLKGSLEEAKEELEFFIVIRDITEKRKIDEMMKSEIKKLKDLDQIRSDLIRRISHELKTPLISIFSGSQYLLDHSIDKVNAQTHRIIELIHMGGYRLKSLADNLILTYNIDSKELNLNLKRNNIIQIIKNCIEDIVFQAKKRKIFINIELLKELYIEVDKSMIKRAISNIISNAVKNTPTNGNIFVSTFDHPNYIDIIVKDDGVGLTKKEKSLLFKRFGKIERYGKGMDVDIEGAGLGLFIANEIVKLHNGEIIVKSKGRNKGSTFTIRLYLS